MEKANSPIKKVVIYYLHRPANKAKDIEGLVVSFCRLYKREENENNENLEEDGYRHERLSEYLR